MNPLSRGFRNTFRSGARAFSIIAILVVIIGLSLTMLIARQAVSDKIASVKSSIGNTITVSPAGERGFGGGDDGSTPLTATNVTTIKNTAHVTSVASTLTARVTSDNTSLTSSFGNGTGTGSSSTSTNSTSTGGASGYGGGFGGRTFTPSVNVTGTTDSANLADIGAITLASGSQIDAGGSADEALVGQSIATTNNLSAGSTFTLYGTTITVKGIINTANDRFAGNSVIVPLATLQALSNQAGDVSNVAVTVDSIDNESAVVSSLQSSLGSSADVVSAQSQAANAVEPLQSIANLSVFVLITSVIVGAIVILLIMVMIVRERRREIGVMKAIGMSNASVGFQFMVEALTMTIIAAVLGIALSILAAGPITNALVSGASTASSNGAGMAGAGGSGSTGRFGGFRRTFGGVNTAARTLTNVTTHINWTIVLYGIGIALIVAIVGSLLASIWVARIKPAEAVRAE